MNGKTKKKVGLHMLVCTGEREREKISAMMSCRHEIISLVCRGWPVIVCSAVWYIVISVCAKYREMPGELANA